MRYRQFPGTDISVSEVGFGTWTLSTGWWGERPTTKRSRCCAAADDFGITFFDAADAYGNGRGERQLAEAFRGRAIRSCTRPRSATTSTTSGARRVAARASCRSASIRDFMRFAVDKCLERLETDYIDVLQLHNIKMEHVRDPPIWETMRELQRRGEDSRVGRGVRAGDRLAVRGRGAVRARARHRHDPDDLEHARAASGHAR